MSVSDILNKDWKDYNWWQWIIGALLVITVFTNVVPETYKHLENIFASENAKERAVRLVKEEYQTKLDSLEDILKSLRKYNTGKLEVDIYGQSDLIIDDLFRSIGGVRVLMIKVHNHDGLDGNGDTPEISVYHESALPENRIYNDWDSPRPLLPEWARHFAKSTPDVVSYPLQPLPSRRYSRLVDDVDLDTLYLGEPESLEILHEINVKSVYTFWVYTRTSTDTRTGEVKQVMYYVSANFSEKNPEESREKLVAKMMVAVRKIQRLFIQ